MLFQNSCVVPFGITAMVNFFVPVGASALVQLSAESASSISANNERILFICVFLFSGNYGVTQTTNSLDQHFHLIARLKKHRRLSREANAWRSARRDHIARLERDRL